jgi:hypothetical protein
VEEWDADRREFVVTSTLGRVEPGEVVSIRFLGDREGAQYSYPNFRVSRRPATGSATDDEPPPELPAAPAGSLGVDQDIPFL